MYFPAPPRIVSTPSFRNLSYVQSKSISNTDVLGSMCSPDGTKLILGLDPSGGDIQNWTMSTPFDVSTLSLASQIPAAGDFPFTNGDFNPDGTEMVYCDPDNNRTYRVSLSTPYVFRDTRIETQTTTTLFGTSEPRVGMQWTDNGTKVLSAQGYENSMSVGTVTTPYTFSGYVGTPYSSAVFPAQHDFATIQLVTIDDVRYCLMVNATNPATLWLVAVEDALVNSDASLIQPIESVVLTDLDVSWGTVGGMVCAARDGRKIIAVSESGRVLEFSWLQQGR